MEGCGRVVVMVVVLVDAGVDTVAVVFAPPTVSRRTVVVYLVLMEGAGRELTCGSEDEYGCGCVVTGADAATTAGVEADGV